MFNTTSYNGQTLPEKTLCFTFDDGPGTHTSAIAQYLHTQGISATFFVVGKYAHHHPEILYTLHSLGHVVANHTYEHPDMPYYWSVNGNVQDQIMRTNAVIQSYIDGPVYFRSPYGKWSAEVANELNSNMMSTINHIGPIHWDVGGVDCYYWQTGRSVEDAVAAYLEDVNKNGKGIVVFHDDIADMDYVKPINKTLELLMQLVPILKTAGYKFVGLHQIDAIKKAIDTPNKCSIHNSKGKFLCLAKDDFILATKANETNSVHAFEIEQLKYGKIAMKAENGKYWCVDNHEPYNIRASIESLTDNCLFDHIPINGNQFMLRSHYGRFVVCNAANGQVTASEPFMRNAHKLFFTTETPAKTSVSFREKLQLLKRAALFIKSKVLSS